MKKKFIVSSLILLSLHTYASNFESAYTSIDEKDCKTLKGDDKGSTQSCAGFAHIKVEVTENDLRQSVTFIREVDGAYPQDFSQTVSPAMSTLDSKIEWRYKKDEAETPLAAITRLNVSENPEEPQKNTSYLVVSKISDHGICVVGKITPQKEQNEKARIMAEKSSEMNCLNSNEDNNSESNNTKLIASWIEPIPGSKDKVQGFKLNADGSASSINMSSLVYSSWETKGNQLILTSKSIGNGETSTNEEVYEYSFCETNHLCLKNPDADEVYKYKKQ